MSYQYNDSTMMIATQVAYLNFNEKDQNVGELVHGLINTYGKKDENGNWIAKEGCSTAEKEQFNTALNIVELSEKNGGTGDWENWTVVDVCNDQDSTGYYGMLIETGDGNAIIANRGSESTNFETGYKDWFEADIGLLDSELTHQQARAEEYMEKLWYQYGGEYDSFSVTGHSLGGNLSQHMTITAPAAMRDKIDHCISYDGPGFSEEYIAAHAEEIAQTAELMDHYQWSWVSSLLNPLPGVEDTIIKAHDDTESDISIVNKLVRHHTRNIEFDENGNVQEGDESDLSEVLGPLSRYIEGSDMEDIALPALLERLFNTLPGTNLPPLFELCVGIKLIAQAYYEFQELSRTLSDFAGNIYYNYIAPNVSGDFTVDTSAVSSMAGELRQIESDIQELCDEIENLRKNISFISVSGGYYRSKLYTILWGMENDVKKLKKMAGVADKAVEIYGNVDKTVMNLFA